MEEILEQERICPFCERTFFRSPRGYREFRFCPECYDERLNHINANTNKNSKISITFLDNGYINSSFARTI